ncbi:hypothetical protein BH09BAC3_BH09BAC3_35990 [soil metagenome]
MRILQITTTALIVCLYSSLSAQEIPEPDFSLKPYYLLDGKLIEFEKVELSMGTKSKGMGYGGVELSYSADGLKSPTRFVSGTVPKIIVKSEDNSDPSEGFSVLMGEIKKDRRRFVTGKVAALVGSNKSNSEKRITISAKKIRDKVFEITFGQTLQSGEYAIIPNTKNISLATGSMAIKINCFGVD